MKIPILRIRDENGNFIPISALKGDKGDTGDNGKSAYEQAKEGGYNGTEEEFTALLNGLTDINDQTPTYTAPEELAELTSGEKMSVILGKVAKGISSLIAHLKNVDNPHKVTLKQVGGAPATHQHSTNDITSGILGLARGGLGADNADDALKNLGAAAVDLSNVPYDVIKNINKHYWKRREIEPGIKVASSDITVSVYQASTGTNVMTLYYADSISAVIDYDSQDAKVVLDNPTTLTYTWAGGGTSLRAPVDVIEGKYWSFAIDGSAPVYYTTTLNKSVNNSSSSSYTATVSGAIVSAEITTKGEIDYLYAESKDIYPNGFVDNYQYEYRGVIKDNILSATRVEIGSYIGTGESWGDNGTETILSFNFIPKVVIIVSPISTYDTQNNGLCMRHFVYGHTPASERDNNSSSAYERLYVSWENNTMKLSGWDTTTNAATQCNKLNATYYYIAFS